MLEQIEIKSAQTFSKSFTKNLNYFKKLLPNKVTSSKIIYDGKEESIFNNIQLLNFRNYNLEN